ncbi:hypothetical protein J5N97_000022 [Dioscorea zingiberensis]|uniref:Leucine-rich repeat-containing N-terminal plant-type domain-containing protein n=1 Tax=Dioscorea zingiberensis TaxID=325984 RepID=A0A9D5BW63_9LILI|nr:hypothetical protein J5N97_000022 [Dioscorea zingiberensis]
MQAPPFSSFLFIILILPTLIFALECVENDKQALLKIKNKFGNPKELSSWIQTTDCCTEWTGVSCDVSLGQVLSLNISNTKNISGPIPDAIGDLPILSYITLHNLPFLTGPLPTSLSNLTLLKTLTITYTSLAGPLPPFITTFTQLSEFNLSHNLISGPLPIFPGDGTYFSIDLSHNYLSGSIPSSLFFGVLTNPILDISFNKITGKIPGSLGKINFGWINMAHNKLTGDASFLFGESKWATLIDLSWNELQFNMSSLRFSTFLENLDLSHNEISGSIPKQIIKAKKLKALNLSYNQLCGRIPTGGPMAKFHSSSYVHNLCLCGRPLPPCRR